MTCKYDTAPQSPWTQRWSMYTRLLSGDLGLGVVRAARAWHEVWKTKDTKPAKASFHTNCFS